jgi:hypothetical protein
MMAFLVANMAKTSWLIVSFGDDEPNGMKLSSNTLPYQDFARLPGWSVAASQLGPACVAVGFDAFRSSC